MSRSLGRHPKLGTRDAEHNAHPNRDLKLIVEPVFQNAPGLAALPRTHSSANSKCGEQEIHAPKNRKNHPMTFGDFEDHRHEYEPA